MTTAPGATPRTGRITVSVDAMGGDNGPAAVVAGLALSAEKNPDIGFLLHGDSRCWSRWLRKRPQLQERCRSHHGRQAQPCDAPRQGHLDVGHLESVREGEAQAAVSCGNTGALMASRCCSCAGWRA
jgi:phosphate acyltransferase